MYYSPNLQQRTNSLIVLLVCIGLTFIGCAGLKTVNVRPAGCEQSVIYDYVPYPDALSIIEISATIKVVANNPQLKPYLVKFTEDMIVLLGNQKITYFDVGRLALDQTKWANGYVGMVVLSTSQILSSFDKPIPVGECDRQFALNHFKRQLQALGG